MAFDPIDTPKYRLNCPSAAIRPLHTRRTIDAINHVKGLLDKGVLSWDQATKLARQLREEGVSPGREYFA